MNKVFNFLKAFSVFAGTIIGVGIFSLPYVASKAGFPIIFSYFLVMAAVAITAHLIYGEIILGTEKIHRFPGYVNEYLGTKWKRFTLLTTTTAITGALLAYLIVGGEFLRFYFAPYFGGGSTVYTLIFFSFGIFFVFIGTKSIAQLDVAFLFFIMALLALLFIRGFGSINMDYLKNIDLKFLTLPYGVVIFSLWGLALVPEIKEIANGDRKMVRGVILGGVIFACLIYLIFIITILGVSGPNTSEEAFSGFSRTLGDGIIRLGFIFGVITTFTSFIALALTLKKTFWYDFGLHRHLAWFVACFVPLGLFLLGLREFVGIIGFVGAVSIGLEAIVLIFLYRKFLEKRHSRKLPAVIYPLIGIFALGIIFEAVYLLLGKI